MLPLLQHTPKLPPPPLVQSRCRLDHTVTSYPAEPPLAWMWCGITTRAVLVPADTCVLSPPLFTGVHHPPPQ